MLKITGRPVRFCDGLNRRTFLRAGFLGLAGLSLSDLLRLRAQAAAAGATRKETAVIMFWLDGGPTHMDTYDLKPPSGNALLAQRYWPRQEVTTSEYEETLRGRAGD